MSEEFSLIYPDKSNSELQKIVKESFLNYCLSETEILLYPLMNKQFILKNVTIEGRDNLNTALGNGNGVLLFQAHFGAFQMTMPSIGYSGYKLNQISASASFWRKSSDSSIQKKAFLIKAKYEYSLPINHIPVSSSLRPVFRALDRNEIVGITVDGGGGKKVVAVKFLSREANFQTGGADLALRTNAVIVPAFIISQPGFKHRLILGRPIQSNNNLEREDRIRRIIEEFASLLEDYVHRYPSHYGYTLSLRRMRAFKDSYPFFADYGSINH